MVQFHQTPLPRGEAGTWRTLAVMQRAVRTDAAHPLVRSTAARVIAGVHPTDRERQAERIYAYVKRVMPYVSDPVDVEAFGTPVFHLTQLTQLGRTFGDCDDAVGLLAALLQSVGIRARFAAGSFRPDRKLHHVWTEAEVIPRPGGGVWREFDPYRAERFGLQPTRVVRVAV